MLTCHICLNIADESHALQLASVPSLMALASQQPLNIAAALIVIALVSKPCPRTVARFHLVFAAQLPGLPLEVSSTVVKRGKILNTAYGGRCGSDCALYNCWPMLDV
jgi:hypothetical protein